MVLITTSMFPRRRPRIIVGTTPWGEIPIHFSCTKHVITLTINAPCIKGHVSIPRAVVPYVSILRQVPESLLRLIEGYLPTPQDRAVFCSIAFYGDPSWTMYFPFTGRVEDFTCRGRSSERIWLSISPWTKTATLFCLPDTWVSFSCTFTLDKDTPRIMRRVLQN